MERQLWDEKVRIEIASRALAGYLASPHYKFEELADYAKKARVAADLLIKELADNPAGGWERDA